MRKLLGALAIFFIFLIFPSSISAEVVINEFLPNASQEWVEFFNKGNASENLFEYYFDDDTDYNDDIGSNKFQLLGILGANSSCYWNLSTFLNNDEDTPTLFKNDGSQIDSYHYSNPVVDKSYSRIPDGDLWQVDQTPLKASVSCQSLAPTSTPSPTPTPTSTPTPTPTKTPTPVPTKSPTPKPTIKPSESPDGTPSDFESSVLSAREDLIESPSPEGEVLSQKSKVQILPIIMIIFGIILLGVGGYPFIKKLIKKYNVKNEELS